MKLTELVAYLDDYLDMQHIPDYSGAFNGLQVEGTRDVQKIAVAVDACITTIEQAVEWDADMMIVHHGLFWGAKAPITGNLYRRIAPLIQNGIALYSTHLPLDAHPEVGNNAVLMRKLGIEPQGSWLPFEGVDIAFWGETEQSREQFVQRVREVLNVEPLVMPFGSATVQRVGICTGGAGSSIDRAAAFGLDTFLTGEGAHHTFFEAEERGLNVLYAGHYATETVGVQALAVHLAERFGLQTAFLDHPTGL
jgi:dinuclear metal center YbgI/SA1388 family protein